MIKGIVVSFLFLQVLHAGMSPEESVVDSKLMTGNFSEIQRFKALEFNDEGLQKESSERLESIMKKIKQYVASDKNIKVQIVSHCNTCDNKQAYQFSKELKQKLLDSDLNEEVLFTQNREDKDPAFVGVKDETTMRSNRVMLSLYID